MANPGRDTPPPPWTKIFLISCSFWENPANLYVGAPQWLAPPPTGNPVSGPAQVCVSVGKGGGWGGTKSRTREWTLLIYKICRFNTMIYPPPENEVWGKVMFLQVSTGVSVQGVSVRETQGGFCPGGSLSRGSLAGGGLPWTETPLLDKDPSPEHTPPLDKDPSPPLNKDPSPEQNPPVLSRAGSTYPTGMHSCRKKYNYFLHKTPAVEYLIIRPVHSRAAAMSAISPQNYSCLQPPTLDPLLHLEGGERQLNFNKLSDLQENRFKW